MPTQKISVIIPAYNAQEYIVFCMKMLEKQTYQNMEVILVNDGSTDQTDAIVRHYLASTPLDVIYLSQENRGQAYSRNRGITHASGTYIAFIDCDDRIEEDYLEQLCSVAEAYTADVVNCGYRTVREDGTVLAETSVSPFADIDDYGRAGVFVVWAKLFRREFLLEWGIVFPEGKLYEDVPFSLEAKFRAKCVKSISYIGYSYVRHSGSTMASGTVRIGQFPYARLNRVAEGLVSVGCADASRLEYEVLYFFAGFLFLYCRKLPAKELSDFCTYTMGFLETYFPNYTKNQYLGWGKCKELSFFYRMAVRIFAAAAYTHTLKPFIWMFTRI